MDGWEASESILEVGGKPYTRQELLAYWISEREKIRLKKEAGDRKPWSDDPVFQNTYFTNVHREDDRVTRWIRENYTLALYGGKYEYSMVVARIFNRPSTLEYLKLDLVPFNLSRIYERLDQWRIHRNTTWGNAYVITTNGVPMEKLLYCLELIGKVYDMEFKYGDCRTTWDFLQKVNGLGSFLSAQVVADLKNTEGHPLFVASDKETFSAPGPGSLRGLAWFFETKVRPGDYQFLIQEAKSILGWEGDMQDLQNCFCEYDKYCRVAYGTGRSKRRYAGAV